MMGKGIGNVQFDLVAGLLGLTRGSLLNLKAKPTQTAQEVAAIIHERKQGKMKIRNLAVSDMAFCDNASVFLLGTVADE